MRALSAFILMLSASPALAQTVVVSAAPSSTSVTVYRDPDRGQGAMDMDWLQGYALISEKRRISLPAGPSVVRFEGVADGMMAVSAVVSGLPGGVDEKNRDAQLLSPAALLDGSLGNRVHIRRTNRQTGKVTEAEAIVRSGTDGAVVLETPEGIEALRCSGLPETLVYDGVPHGLSAKPTFSVHTNSPRATEAEVTLTYLATGFDWGANYVAKVAEDGKTLDLLAWLTVANGNGATYDETELLAVAGKPNRTSDFDELSGDMASPYLNLDCWPMGTTSMGGGGPGLPAPPPVALAMAAPMAARYAAEDAGSIIVTANKVMAQQEELGDLKLYRVPVRVNVVPNGQKQVALLEKEKVPFSIFYSASVWSADDESQALTRMIRMQNKKKEGLGLPLPSGGIIVMQHDGGQELLLSDTAMPDRAIDEKVEIEAGASDPVRYLLTELDEPKSDRDRYRLELTNALDAEVQVEIRIDVIGDDQKPAKADGKLIRQDGHWLWKSTVPANGARTLTFSVVDL